MKATPTSTPLSAPADTTPSAGYAWFVVIIMMTCYTLSFIDRQILGLLVRPIQQDLGIRDTETALLQGLAFAIFYSVLGIPFGRMADRHSRRNIIAAGVFVWSIMTGLCAIARSYTTLFFARMGVGVGEATLGPSAFSMISDYFPKERLGTALSVYSMGIFIGSGLASIVGGSVVDAVTGLPAVTLPIIGTIASWRLTFLIVGIPGILVALLVGFVREPARKNLMRNESGQVSRLSIGDVFAQMSLRWKSVLGLSMALGFQSSCNYALIAWTPAYFQRVHQWTAGEIGRAMGLIVLIAGCIGLYVGGKLADRWQQRGVRHSALKVGFIGGLGSAVFGPLALMMPDAGWIIALLAPTFFFTSIPVGSSYASFQMIFPNQVRGQVSAFFLLAINLFGLTLGPLWPALLTDYVFRNPLMIGTALAISFGGSAVMTALMYRVSYSPYQRDHAKLHSA